MTRLHGYTLTIIQFILCFSHLVCGFRIEDHLGTKSAYVPQQTNADRIPPPDGCSVAYANLIARHGSRNPSNGDIKTFQELNQELDKEEHNIPNKDFYSWLIDWVQPYDILHAGQLRDVGEEELYLLAKRLLEDFPAAFTETSMSKNYPIRTSAVPRAARSGLSFGYGLFEGRGSLGPSKLQPFFTYSESKSLDRVIRFFKTCPKFKKEVYDNEDTYKESKDYLEMHVPKISQRLGKQLGFNLSNSAIIAMHKACAFESTLSDNELHFCSLFTQEEVEMFEYANDLELYYESGYGGSSLGHDIACPLLRDMIDTFDHKISGQEEHLQERASLRFGHAETIVPFVTLLGLNKDAEKLTSRSSQQTISSRKWRMSKISPFAANVLILLYNCTSRGDGVDYRVNILHNERQVKVDACDDMYCPYDEFKAIYQGEPLHCNFERLCSLEDEAEPTPVPASDQDVREPDAPAIHGVPVINPQFAITMVIGLIVGAAGGYWMGTRNSPTVKEPKTTSLDEYELQDLKYANEQQGELGEADTATSEKPGDAKEKLLKSG